MKFRNLTLVTLRAMVVTFTALLLGVVLARHAGATFIGTNGQIAFTQGDLNGIAPTNIFTANPDGLEQKQLPLPNGIGVESFSEAVWSPDGSKLLISHTQRLDSTGQFFLFQPATVKPDGSEFNQLVPPTPPGGPSANGIDCPVWLLDQTRILCAFNDSTTGTSGAFSIRASDGGDPVRLTTNPYSTTGGFDLPTDISPDGTRFVFLRYKPGARPQPNPDRTQQVALFVENIDGTDLRQITPFGLALPHDFASANWSPDGREIISALSHGRLFVVHLDGTGLTPINLDTGTQQYFAFQPHWSPDGKRILFCMFINGGEGIYTANLDGSEVKQATFATNPLTVFNAPDWGMHPLQ
jgi:Tol biopolymer transport system component